MSIQDKRWVIKVGLDSSGAPAARQKIYQSFSSRLQSLGLDAELKQTGLMGVVTDEVLVELSSPEGERFYYGLATPRQVERVVSEHIVGGKPITEWFIPSGDIRSSVSRKKGAASPGGAISADAGIWRTAINLLSVGWWLGISIIAGVLSGLWLDDRFNTRPLFTLLGLFLGLAFAFFGVYRVVLPIVRNKEGMKTTTPQPGVRGVCRGSGKRGQGAGSGR